MAVFDGSSPGIGSAPLAAGSAASQPRTPAQQSGPPPWGLSGAWRCCAIVLLLGPVGCVLPELDLVPAQSDAEVCLPCAEESCSETYDSCFAETECETLVSCALACPSGDAECATDCSAASPDGLDPALALFECAGAACPEDCSSVAAFGR